MTDLIDLILLVIRSKLTILLLGLLIILYSYYYYVIKKKFLEKKYFFNRYANIYITFIVVIITCIFLLNITSKPDLILGMKISDMDLSTAQHYHSMITNIILGFSAVVGIGITLLWPSQGQDWRIHNCWLLLILLFYFILVMYSVFLRELSNQIAISIPKVIMH